MSAKNKCWAAALSTDPRRQFGRRLAEDALCGCAVFSVIRGYAFGESISVNAEDFGGIREVFSVSRQRLFDIDLFKLRYGLIQQYLTVKHFIDQGFELGAHLHVGD